MAMPILIGSPSAGNDTCGQGEHGAEETTAGPHYHKAGTTVTYWRPGVSSQSWSQQVVCKVEEGTGSQPVPADGLITTDSPADWSRTVPGARVPTAAFIYINT